MIVPWPPNSRVRISGAAGPSARGLDERIAEIEARMRSHRRAYDRDTALQNDQTVLRGIQHIDAGPRQAASFVFCDQLVVG